MRDGPRVPDVAEAEQSEAVKLSTNNRALETIRRARIVCAELGVEKALAALSEREFHQLTSLLEEAGAGDVPPPTASGISTWGLIDCDRGYSIMLALLDMAEARRPRPEALRRQDRAKRLRLQAKRGRDKDDERHMELIIDRLRQEHACSRLDCVRLGEAYAEATSRRVGAEAAVQNLGAERDALRAASTSSTFRRLRGLI